MRSLVTRVNPLVLIAFGLLAIVGSFAVRDVWTGIIAFGAYVVVALLFLPTWRFPLVCLGFVAFAALTLFYSTWLLGGRDLGRAFSASLRILVLAWPGSVLAGFIDPTRLADYLAQRLGLPDRFVVAFSAAIQRLTQLRGTWEQLARTRRIRGFGPGRNPIAVFRHAGSMTFGLLVSALRDAMNMSIAMDARGFATAHDRTWAEAAPWTRLDSAAVAMAVAMAAVAPVLSIV